VSLDPATTPELYGEDQGRYLVACNFDQAEALFIAAGQAGVPVASVGTFGGDTVNMGGSSAPLAELSDTYRTSFAAAVA
ncbi:MAG: phosphoribosylformylglycinamidine synthase II, partial [Halocynthiibacter sp.]